MSGVCQTLQGPFWRYRNFDADFLGRDRDELADRVLLAGGDDEVFRLVLLRHQPLHDHVVARMAPVALGIEVWLPPSASFAKRIAGWRCLGWSVGSGL